MTETGFSDKELERYSRHLILPGFGIEGQRKLKAAKVLVVGAGGLGSAVLKYLAAAGVGKISIIDSDTVSTSNLQRQVLYETGDIGNKKAEVAKIKLSMLNPHTDIEIYDYELKKKYIILGEDSYIAFNKKTFFTVSLMIFLLFAGLLYWGVPAESGEIVAA